MRKKTLIPCNTRISMGQDSAVGMATHCESQGMEIFCTHPDQPWCPPSLLYSGYQDSCKANARINLAKTGHGPHSHKLLCSSMYCLFCVVLCTLCV